MGRSAVAGNEPNLVALADGRQLAWAELGDPAGKPVVFFHGGPGSRRPLFPGQGQAAARLGVRLLLIERPGFGDSTRHPARTLAGWPSDVAAWADEINLERFALIGYSAGAPHALACAAKLADRLTHVVVVGCGAPWDRPELAGEMDWPRRTLRWLARHAPWLLRLTYRSLPDPHRHPEKLVRTLLAGLPAPDLELFERPEIFRVGVDHTIAGVRQGFAGMADEVLLLAQPWGFDLESIPIPVTLWWGTEDSAAPRRQTEFLVARIPNAELRRVEGEGHLCIINHWSAILESALG